MRTDILKSSLRLSEVLDVTPGFMCAGYDPERRMPRPSDCFVYVFSGRVEYHFASETVTAAKGCVVYLPRGSTYFMRVREPYRHIFVNFQFDVGADVQLRPACVERVQGLENDFQSMRRCWLKGSDSQTLRCMGLLYQIYAALIEHGQSRYLCAGNRAVVERAVKMMEARLSDHEFGVAQTARALNVSPAQLRRLFQSVYGIAPIRFLQQKRIHLAKQLLAETDLPITRIAELSGFCNAYYFSRVFALATGLAPTLYRVQSAT